MNKEFVDGLFVNRREKAPEFVKASLSFKVEKFIAYLKSKANAAGYVNIDVLVSRDGKFYAKLNDYQPKQETIELPESEDESEVITPEEIPF